MLLSKGREVAYVGEQHGDLAARTAERAQISIREDLLHNLLTQETAKGVAQNLCFGDVVHQNHHTLIFATLVIQHLPMDRAVMFAPARREQAMFLQRNTPMAFNLIGKFLEREARPTGKD